MFFSRLKFHMLIHFYLFCELTTSIFVELRLNLIKFMLFRCTEFATWSSRIGGPRNAEGLFSNENYGDMLAVRPLFSSST